MPTTPATDPRPDFAATTYRRPFRRYQQLALDAFEQARAVGKRRFYVVLPPGAGKTVLGLEVARRLGNRTLALCPNTAVQGQWLGQWGDFRPATVAAGHDPSLAAPLTALTYQALCTFDASAETLDEQALAHWQRTLRAEHELSEEQAAAELHRLASATGRHYRAELGRFRRHARTLVARGGERAELLGLLHPNGRALVERLKGRGPWTLVLDECHHLLEMWGYLVGALIDELGEATEVAVVGLTATPPGAMSAREAALYHELFGRADFEVPTPRWPSLTRSSSPAAPSPAPAPPPPS